MSNIIKFTGETTLDLEPDDVLTGAVGALDQVVIVGVEKDTGLLYVASSRNHRGETSILLQLATAEILDDSSW